MTKLTSLKVSVLHQTLLHRDPTVDSDLEPNPTWQLVGDDIREPRLSFITVCATDSWRATTSVPCTRRTSNNHQSGILNITSSIISTTHRRIPETNRTKHYPDTLSPITWCHCKLFYGLVFSKLQQNQLRTVCWAWKDNAKW
jgi:hypothetical protein